MIDSQDLYKIIPKKVEDWTVQDVNKWFQVNDITAKSQINITGKELLSLTPTKLLTQLKVSNFLARKISDWLEFEVRDFEQYLQEMGNEQPRKLGKQDQQQLSIEQHLENYENLPTQMTKCKKKSSFQEQKQSSYESQKNKKKSSSSQSQKSMQIYKPLKYKAKKSNQKKINFFAGKDQIKQSKASKKVNKASVQKKDLILSSLLQNSQNRQDVQTCKHLPENSQYFGKSKQAHSQMYDSCSSDISSLNFQKDIRFVSSQLLLAQSCTLIACFNDSVFQVEKHSKIGRNSSNDMILRSDGVSRNHAEIILQEEKDQSGKMRKRYFLKDIGSKFGTFVQSNPQRPKKVKQQESYCIGSTTFYIQRVKVYKVQKKFDLVAKIQFQQEETKTFNQRTIISVGNKKKDTNSNITKRKNKEKKDIQLDDFEVKNYHCRFVLINDQVYLEQVQGNIMERINKGQMFQFVKPQTQVKFGDQNVTFCLETNYKALSNLAQLINQ